MEYEELKSTIKNLKLQLEEKEKQLYECVEISRIKEKYGDNVACCNCRYGCVLSDNKQCYKEHNISSDEICSEYAKDTKLSKYLRDNKLDKMSLILYLERVFECNGILDRVYIHDKVIDCVDRIMSEERFLEN